jgi:myo-inositol-1(or 4)-monophosphatase
LRAPEPTTRAPLRDELETIVREAGALAASTFRGTQLKSWTKSGDSPVSEADIAVDRFLRERLMRLAPDCGWLSEETEDDRARLGGSRLWIVDPIDGTRAYLGGRTDWAVSVALVESGRPAAAAVFAPMEDGLYLAAAGEGATRDGEPIAASTGSGFEGACVAGPKPMIGELEQTAAGIVGVSKVHSLALRLTRVAAGRLDIAFASKNSHDWDVAAADLIVHEAGGALTALDGRTVIYNSAEARHGALVAAGATRHARVIAITRDWQARRALHDSLA